MVQQQAHFHKVCHAICILRFVVLQNDLCGSWAEHGTAEVLYTLQRYVSFYIREVHVDQDQMSQTVCYAQHNER